MLKKKNPFRMDLTKQASGFSNLFFCVCEEGCQTEGPGARNGPAKTSIQPNRRLWKITSTSIFGLSTVFVEVLQALGLIKTSHIAIHTIPK